MPQSGGFNRTIKIIIGIIDVIIYHLSFVLAFNIRYRIINYSNWSDYINALPWIMVTFVLMNILFGMYVLYDKRDIDFITTTTITQFMMTVIIMAFTFLGRWFAFPRTIVVISFVISTVLLLVWRLIVLRIYWSTSGTSRVMIIGGEAEAKQALYSFIQADSKQYKVNALNVSNHYTNVVENLDETDVYYLLEDIDEAEQSRIISLLTFQEKRIFLSSDFQNITLMDNKVMNIDDESIIAVSRFEIPPENDLIKRIFDLMLSIMMLIVTSPILLVTALAVKLDSKGPVFYRQTRITRGGKEFDVLKFRSMRQDAEKLSGPVLAQEDDPRVTKVGRIIRSLRIDELPQLFNVLKGEMSLVGPRPERPYFVDQFIDRNQYYALRHHVRAGITGYAQVYGKYSTNFTNKLRFDLLYIKNYSIGLDLQILFQTVKILFDKVSSQGVTEEESGEVKLPEGVSIYE
ncbi:MAG: sugar transferase [Atopococcus tabaci]|uniref:Sugar transferase n=1 Tax=Atopococcus tabaci TaxID=269774 RepID=A0AA43RKA3_9LACT|nr:sugar transferase [Atopococcus tabaci]